MNKRRDKRVPFWVSMNTLLKESAIESLKEQDEQMAIALDEMVNSRGFSKKDIKTLEEMKVSSSEILKSVEKELGQSEREDFGLADLER